MSLNENSWKITGFYYYPNSNKYVLTFEDIGDYYRKDGETFSASITHADVLNLPQLDPLYSFEEPLQRADSSDQKFTTQITITDAPRESRSDDTVHELIFQYFVESNGDPGPEDIKVKPKIKFSEAKEKRNSNEA